MSYGDADSHLPIFSGPAARDESGVRAFARWLKGRRFRGAVILEQWPEPPDMLERAREKFKKILD